MNELKAWLTPDYREIEAKKLHLAFHLTIDGGSPLQNTDDDFDLFEFIMSTRKDGTYFIWTCSCGVPGCAGYFHGIEVNSNGGTTHWNDHDLHKRYVFHTPTLHAQALAVEDEIKRWHSHAKSTGVELIIWPAWSMEDLLSALDTK